MDEPTTLVIVNILTFFVFFAHLIASMVSIVSPDWEIAIITELSCKLPFNI